MTDQKKLQLIIDEVCKYYDQPQTMVRSHDRHRIYAMPRHVYCYFAREMTDCSLRQIGAALRRDYDHASVHCACDLITGLIRIGVVTYEIQKLRAQINNRILEEMNFERMAFLERMGSLTWNAEVTV